MNFSLSSFFSKRKLPRSAQKNDMTERRAAIVEALNKAIEIFTFHGEKIFEDVMTNGIRPFAEAVGLDRVVFYRRLNIDGNIRFGQIYRWDKAGGGLTSLDDELKVLPDTPLMAHWISILSEDGRVRIRESEMAEDERAFSNIFGLKSIMIIPIFTRGEFWGGVSLQDHTTDRYFDEDCADLLYSAARLFASAIIQAEMTQSAEEAIEALKYREELTSALNKTAVLFLAQTEGTFENTMTAGVQLIADTLKVDRLSVWRNASKPDGLHASQIYRWDRESGGTTPPVPEMQDVPYNWLSPRWEKLLAGKVVINGPSCLLPESEAAILKSFGIASHFVTPININNSFWGFVFFEDCKNERYFDENSVEMMNSAAFLCVNTIIREEMEQQADKAVNELKRREKMINMLNKVAILFLSQTEDTFENIMTVGVRMIVDAVDVDRLSIWRNTMMSDGLHTAQIYRWDKNTGGTTNPTPGLEDVTYTQLAPRWEELLAKNEIINSPTHLLPEAAMLKSFGVVSALVIPVFFNDAFWGFVLFEDRKNERYFDEESIEMMHSATLLCANAVNRAEMERDILEANERTRLMLDTIPISCQWWDRDMNIIDCNNAAVKLFGLNNKQEFFDTFFNLMPEYQPDGQRSDEKAVVVIKKAFEDGKYEFEWMHRLADGTLMDSEVNLERLKYRNDYILVGYVRDLRKQKQLMREIEQASELNRVLVKSAPIGITIFDHDSRFIDFNDSILNVYGGTKEQFSDNFANFSPEYQDDGSKSADKIMEIVKRTLNGESMVYEWMHRSISGELIPFEVTTIRVKRQDNYIGVAFQYNLSNIKKMEQELIEANEYNRATLDAAPIGINMFDDNLRLLDSNGVVLKLFGCDKQYCIDHFLELSPKYQPDGLRSDEKAVAALTRALGGENLVFEWIHRSLSGELIPFEITLARVKFKGKYIVLGYQYDLRNIKKMEQNVAEAEGMTHSITEASSISYMLFDENFRPVDCNDVLLKLVGCSDKQYFLEHYWDAFVPESQPDGNNSFKRARALAKTMGFNEQVTIEWLQRSVDGELIPMENTLKHIIYRGKKFFVTFKYDMRNIKKMMESIREQGELLKIRLEQQELISEITRSFIASGDSTAYVTEAIAKLGHYQEASLVIISGINYERNELYTAYNWSADNVQLRFVEFDLLALIKSSFPEKIPDRIAMPALSCVDTAADPAYQALLAADVNAFICVPLYVEGRLWGALSVEQCYTPRQWTDNEKGFVAIMAGTIAGVIMRDIYNTRLQDALHRATEASRAKSDFLSNMSHEMRTPLNAIIGMTAIGRSAADIERKDHALDKIDNASAHLLGVINDVLDMSKIEAKMLELSPVEFHFEKMLQRVVNVVNFRVEEKHQKFMVHIDRQIPKTLIGDDQRLAQVITNLLGNAVKFTPEEGSISLDSRLLEEENGLCTIQISVVDTGIGISSEQQKRVFVSFEQAESSTTRKFGGTGLGLAISKNIVEMMGGNIWIESELNKGTAFIFTIKMQRGTAKNQSLLDSNINLSNVRIMAVDDDPDILDYLREVIQGIGASCDTAISGMEALGLVKENGSYNIYFVDWKMPVIDGIALTGMLKAKSSGAGNTVVIMISAAEWNTVEAEARKSGVDKFLSKPLFSSTIVDVINECIGTGQKPEKQGLPDMEGCFTGRRILLAEDVDINREIVIALLEPTGVEIDCAENGAEAVRMFSEAPGKYDLIFMDVQMPEMDGYEATRRIRALEAPESKTIRIIAMTANVFREDIEKCLEAGMDNHLGKPLDFDEVLEKMWIYLQ